MALILKPVKKTRRVPDGGAWELWQNQTRCMKYSFSPFYCTIKNTTEPTRDTTALHMNTKFRYHLRSTGKISVCLLPERQEWVTKDHYWSSDLGADQLVCARVRCHPNSYMASYRHRTENKLQPTSITHFQYFICRSHRNLVNPK